MTIRVRRSTQPTIISPEQIAALITQSILRPTNDDAPHADMVRPRGAWLEWSHGCARHEPTID